MTTAHEDDVQRRTIRARAAANSLLADAFSANGELPEVLPTEVVRDLMAAAWGTGQIEGLKEGKVAIEEMQGHLENLKRMLEEDLP
jgi:hypothetical protein